MNDDALAEKIAGKSNEIILDHNDALEFFGGAKNDQRFISFCCVVGDGASWNLKDVESGKYDIYVKYSLPEGRGGGKYELYTESSKTTDTTKPTGKGWSNPVEKKCGSITISKNDKNLAFKVVKLNGGDLWGLLQIRLVKVK